MDLNNLSMSLYMGANTYTFLNAEAKYQYGGREN